MSCTLNKSLDILELERIKEKIAETNLRTKYDE